MILYKEDLVKSSPKKYTKPRMLCLCVQCKILLFEALSCSSLSIWCTWAQEELLPMLFLSFNPSTTLLHALVSPSRLWTLLLTMHYNMYAIVLWSIRPILMLACAQSSNQCWLSSLGSLFVRMALPNVDFPPHFFSVRMAPHAFV